MTDHIEVETGDLQDKIQELEDERRERHEQEANMGWLRYIGLSTAFLAVFAAVGALQSGNLVNEAMLHQIQASDTWAEYQASRQKDHLYTLTLNGLVDSNPSNAALLAEMRKPAPPPQRAGDAKPDDATSAESTPEAAAAPLVFAPKSIAARGAEYRSKIYDEMSKEQSRSAEAKRLEEDSAEEIRKHHHFEYSVALIQVAIAVGAVSALTRVKPVWYVSLAAGAVGAVLFVMGFLA
jgi:hypothetical protein